MGGDEQDDPFSDQIAQNNAEMERQRQALVQRRVDIIKSQGQPVWDRQETAKPQPTDLVSALTQRLKGR